MFDANAPHSATPKMTKLDPKPWANDFGYRFENKNQNVIYEGLVFNPRPGYSQNIEDYK